MAEREFTEGAVYVPNDEIDLAFSVEGFLNNGVRECGVVMAQAMGTSLTDHEMEAFIKMRPVVNKAFEYKFVIDTIRSRPEEARAVVENPQDMQAFDVLISEFNARSSAASDAEKKGLDEKFYAVRKELQKDYKSWLSLQSPFEHSLNELRLIVEAQRFDEDGNFVAGFLPWYATSKDALSTKSLCDHYAQTGKMMPDDVDMQSRKCIIPYQRIIGKERVPSREKIEQLNEIRKERGVKGVQVWTLNDRYSDEDVEKIVDGGFGPYILLPGYSFPHDFEKARGLAEKTKGRPYGRVIVIDNIQGLAKKLGALAIDLDY